MPLRMLILSCLVKKCHLNIIYNINHCPLLFPFIGLFYGEDEEDCPLKKRCEPGSKCHQQCVILANGTDACSCHTGYTLNSDGYRYVVPHKLKSFLLISFSTSICTVVAVKMGEREGAIKTVVFLGYNAAWYGRWTAGAKSGITRKYLLKVCSPSAHVTDNDCNL